MSDRGDHVKSLGEVALKEIESYSPTSQYLEPMCSQLYASSFADSEAPIHTKKDAVSTASSVW